MSGLDPNLAVQRHRRRVVARRPCGGRVGDDEVVRCRWWLVRLYPRRSGSGIAARECTEGSLHCHHALVPALEVDVGGALCVGELQVELPQRRTEDAYRVHAVRVDVTGERLVTDVPKVEVKVRCPKATIVGAKFVDDEDAA